MSCRCSFQVSNLQQEEQAKSYFCAWIRLIRKRFKFNLEIYIIITNKTAVNFIKAFMQFAKHIIQSI